MLGERVAGRIIARKAGEEVMVMVEPSYEIARRGCSRGTAQPRRPEHGLSAAACLRRGSAFAGRGARLVGHHTGPTLTQG